MLSQHASSLLVLAGVAVAVYLLIRRRGTEPVLVGAARRFAVRQEAAIQSAAGR